MAFAALSFALVGFALAAGAYTELQTLKKRGARLEQDSSPR